RGSMAGTDAIGDQNPFTPHLPQIAPDPFEGADVVTPPGEVGDGTIQLRAGAGRLRQRRRGRPDASRDQAGQGDHGHADEPHGPTPLPRRTTRFPAIPGSTSCGTGPGTHATPPARRCRWCGPGPSTSVRWPDCPTRTCP